MRIMIFDVAADSGGALSVLQDYYQDLVQTPDGNEYFFVISTPELKEMQNITVINFPWIKRSWFSRIYFDHIVAPRLISQYGIEKIISLQNLTIPHTKMPQTVLVHNALPFAEYRFSIFSDTRLWVYQNLIGFFIKNSIKNASQIIVQTVWMKDRCLPLVGYDDSRIIVKKPNPNIQVEETYCPPINGKVIFFYPASAEIFKNHRIILKACSLLNRKELSKIEFIFTLSGNETRQICKLRRLVEKKGFPIGFAGKLSRENVNSLYSSSILIFPSLIESFGLPLLEARLHQTPIITSDRSFSREVLLGYENVQFFIPNDEVQLVEHIKSFLYH